MVGGVGNRSDEDDHQRAAGQSHCHRDARRTRRAGGLSFLQLLVYLGLAIGCDVDRGRIRCCAAISMCPRRLSFLATKQQQFVGNQLLAHVASKAAPLESPDQRQRDAKGLF